MSFDAKSLTKVQQVALVSGALTLLLSMFGSYIRASVGGGLMPGVSFGGNAWTSYAAVGMLLLLVGIVIVTIRVVRTEVLPAGIPWNLIAALASAAGTALVLLRAFTVGGGGLGVSVGPGWSGWALFVTSIAFTACTVLMLKASGEKLSDLKKPSTPPEQPQI